MKSRKQNTELPLNASDQDKSRHRHHKKDDDICYRLFYFFNSKYFRQNNVLKYLINCSYRIFVILYNREVEMDFFRRNKKIIVGFIFAAVALWLLGGTALVAVLSMGN